MKYQEPLFRPPAEADSLIFQVARGCPHNTCRFCGMYKGVAYRTRPLDEVLDEISSAAARYPLERRVFLADGDVMALPFDYLHALMLRLNAMFPRLARVNTYANGSSINARSPAELLELRRLKLNTLYLGLESGNEELLELVDKRETAAGMTAAVNSAQSHGFKVSVMVLLGLGGRKLSEAHARDTALVLNQMQPRLLSALRFVQVPGTRRFSGYEPVSEYGAVAELKAMIEGFELRHCVFRANHSSNPIPLEGRFPQDRQTLIAELDVILASGQLDTVGPGRLPLFL